MKNTLKSHTPNPEPIAFTHRIGSTVYTVNLHQGMLKSESLEDKILRMMKNDLKIVSNIATIGLPQADRLPERGSS